MKFLLLSSLICLLLPACQPSSSSRDNEVPTTSPSSVVAIGAMKNVMWKGQLDGIFSPDSLSDSGFYGVGPLAGLRGEIMVYDGTTYVSQIQGDGSPLLDTTTKAKAPFFVYARERNWDTLSLPNEVQDLASLEKYLDESSPASSDPFVFRLEGQVDSANIHIQNLPPGSTVSSPKEAHSGQTPFQLGSSNAKIVGFFSREHQGIFTHHDTFLHMHLLCMDRKMMGHLDAVHFSKMQLLLPDRGNQR